MNIVEILSQQLGGEVTKTLGGMAGASENDITKILGAAVPGLLSGLGSLASSKEGAGKIADAVGGIDPGLLGNLAGMLGSTTASKGGSMLGNLFSASMVDGLSGAISKFTGINAGIVKTVLGYLTPMILGTVGKNLGGGKIDASSISRMFSEQKSNIASSLPSGFSLNSIQGFSSLANQGSPSRQPAPQPAAPSGGGFGKLLFPLIIAAALAGLYFFWTNAQKIEKETKEAAEKAASVVKDSAAKTMESAESAASAVKDSAAKTLESAEKMASDAGKSVSDALGDLSKVNLDTIKGDFTSMFDGLSGKLGEIVDAAGAEKILPELQEYATKLDGLSKSVTALPAEGKTAIVDLLKPQLEKLNPILEKFTGISGLGEAVLQVIEQIKDKLKALIS